MIKYIKMKIFYHKMHISLYELLNHSDELIDVINKLVIGCKDMTPEQIKKEFISELAGFAHDQAVKERSKEKKNGQ